MCMHVTIEGMRTTVEIRDEQRARLLALAARRGEKGFSSLVQEALDTYLAEVERREDRIREALAVLGSIDDAEAEAMRESARRIRATWR